jgi:hypothetical protein
MQRRVQRLLDHRAEERTFGLPSRAAHQRWPQGLIECCDVLNSESDGVAGVPVVIVNESFARMSWRVRTPWESVGGVAATRAGEMVSRAAEIINPLVAGGRKPLTRSPFLAPGLKKSPNLSNH